MAHFSRLEDIDAWKEARALASAIYKVTSAGPWAKDFGLRDQVRRAAVSIACNIAEGYARETNTEFVRFLVIARGSASEVKTQLYIALDLDYLVKETFDEFYTRIDKICRMITGLMDYLKRHAAGKPTTANRQPSTKSIS